MEHRVHRTLSVSVKLALTIQSSVSRWVSWLDLVLDRSEEVKRAYTSRFVGFPKKKDAIR